MNRVISRFGDRPGSYKVVLPFPLRMELEFNKAGFEDRIKLKFIVKKSCVSRSRTNNNGVNSRIRTNSRRGGVSLL